ncbi:uncharacterized protein [Drosophila suzukii]|uniref:Uncharacterized protein n=1 Tax=Drosophila suzukii TaxID=28584 RepID=A0ABM4TN96_DROSZ
MSSLDLINFGLYIPEKENILAVTHHADLDTMVRSFMEMDNVQPNQSLLDSRESFRKHSHALRRRGLYRRVSLQGWSPAYRINSSPGNQPPSLKISKLKKQYEEFLDDYLQRGHMEQLTSAQVMDDPDTCVYLPHHAVIKQDSLTTKCRVVFDGSGKDSSGISLNDRLHIGPPIQRDFLGVCLRFRQHRYVLCADIEKMFRGIQVSRRHTNFQRIVWRKNENEPMLHFRLLTVTYGLAPSPFLAV